jgi:hypothetical protein
MGWPFLFDGLEVGPHLIGSDSTVVLPEEAHDIVGVQVWDSERSDIVEIERFGNHVREGKFDLVMKPERRLVSHMLAVFFDDHGAGASCSMDWMNPRANGCYVSNASDGKVLVDRQN